MLRPTIFLKLALSLVTAGMVILTGEGAIASLASSASLQSLSTTDYLSKAQDLNQAGAHQLSIGNAQAALELWKEAEAAYTRAGDTTGQFGSRLNQVQALKALGQYRRARTLLEQINAHLNTLPVSALKASSLRSLGIVLLRIGDLSESKRVLESSLEISQQLKEDPGSTLLALGNLSRAQAEQDQSKTRQTHYFRAIALYQEAAATTNPETRLQARLNLLSLLADSKQAAHASLLFPEIQSLLETLPLGRSRLYAQVNFAESLIKLAAHSSQSATAPAAIAQLLADTVHQAKSLGDVRSQAYALGQLGYLYETSKQWKDAEQVTRQAIQIAQSIQAEDIAVSWQWQLGRILHQQGRTPEAIEAYSQAVDTLGVLRGDLVAINPDAQFSFREQVEPIYRQLVQLLLEEPTQSHLQQARAVIEALQIAELNNFFREACLDTLPQSIEQVDPKAAVIYSILLPDRLAVILSLPEQSLRYHFTRFPASSQETSLSQNQGNNRIIDQTFDDLFASLSPFISSANPLQPHQKIYDWLIRPFEQDLAGSETQTLVFVLDGILQGLPLAALHDGQQYLIEKYSLALTPGLQILPSRSLTPGQFRTLAGGISEERPGFSALPGVAEEIEQISTLVPANVLLNQAFTTRALNEKLASAAFPIVHLATHGQFSSQVDNTFLLTWDGRIQVRDLDRLLEMGDRQNQPIELLILSACQTAKGDKRAVLGMAGVALRSGARSTIATLWSVQDDSTSELMTQFYIQLQKPGITRAEALRQAQLSLLRSSNYQHPYHWAPFVLIGNWR
ncbi:MAG TPA: CHAT domain-containing protein [Allocoleopsis sp.]